MLFSYESFDIEALSESTVYLLGDSELIALWEEAHKRKIMNYKADYKAKQEHLKPTELGIVQSDKEYNTALKSKFKSGEVSKYNYRTNLRDNEKSRKERKKHLYKDRQAMVQDIYKNGGKDHFKVEKGNNSKKAILHRINNDYRKYLTNRNKKKTYTDPDHPDYHNAAYNHRSNAIYTTNNDVDNGTYEHEKQHWRDHMYLRGKYGKQRANQIAKKQHKLDYYSQPTEINAYQKGKDVRAGNNIDRTKEFHKRLDDFVKTGKSKETVPEENRT